MLQVALGLGGLALTVPLTLGSIMLSGAVLGRLYLGEPVTRRAALAMAVLLGSIVVLSIGAQEATNSVSGQPLPGVSPPHQPSETAEPVSDVGLLPVLGGVLAACLAGFSFGSGGVVIRRCVTGKVSLPGTLAVISTTGAIALALASFLRLGAAGIWATSFDELLVMLVAGVLNALGFFTVTRAFQLIPVVTVNAISSSQAALCAIAGVAFFREAPTIWLLLGIAMTSVGLMLLGDRRKTKLNQSNERATETDPPAGNHSASKTAAVAGTESTLKMVPTNWTAEDDGSDIR